MESRALASIAPRIGRFMFLREMPLFISIGVLISDETTGVSLHDMTMECYNETRRQLARAITCESQSDRLMIGNETAAEAHIIFDHDP